MKNLIFLFIVLANASLVGAQDSTKVLFIGNSITYVNSMPQIFEDIANSLGDTTKVTVYATGGTGFSDHVTNSTVFSLFRQGDWDFIVLQPGSYESSGDSYPIEQTLSRALILVDSIYEYNPCTKVLFYEVPWGVFGNSEDDLIAYNNTMDLIRSNLEYLSDSAQLFFAPVGEAFRTSWNNDQNNMLWISYVDLHPNLKGSYLAACVFYSSIFQKSSLGSQISGNLSAADALDCQQLSDTIVLDHLSEWRINTYYPLSDFKYTADSETVFFNNQSHYIDSVLWDFGDGSSSNVLNPNHIYSAFGNYTVSLTRYFHGCMQIVEKSITLSTLDFIEVRLKTNSRIYPNPVNTVLNIELRHENDNYFIEIYDYAGMLIQKTDKLRINVSKYSNGIYFLKIFNAKREDIEVLKWIKN